MLSLDSFKTLREKERHPLENGGAGQDKKPVGWVRLVAGLVQVE
jgi:hypothetical protein